MKNVQNMKNKEKERKKEKIKEKIGFFIPNEVA